MIVDVLVKSNSKKSEVVIEEDIYHIYTKSPAKEGKANQEVIDLLSEFFNIPKSRIRIKSGERYKRKLIEIL